jgi:hypothetical protein
MPIVRNSVVVVTEKDGTKRVITTATELQKWFDALSKEDAELYKARYRFEPVRNKTGIIDYTGTLRDL